MYRHTMLSTPCLVNTNNNWNVSESIIGSSLPLTRRIPHGNHRLDPNHNHNVRNYDTDINRNHNVREHNGRDYDTEIKCPEEVGTTIVESHDCENIMMIDEAEILGLGTEQEFGIYLGLNFEEKAKPELRNILFREYVYHFLYLIIYRHARSIDIHYWKPRGGISRRSFI